MGVTEAVLRLMGTEPDGTDALTMFTMHGQTAGRQALTRAVGTGSREQVEALALVTSSVI